MKNLLAIFCIGFITINVKAQTDTLKPVSFSDSCSWRTTGDNKYIPDLALFSNPLGGYVCGRSTYEIKTKAQKFYHKDGTLKQVAFLFGELTQSIFPGIYVLKFMVLIRLPVRPVIH